LVYKKLIKCAVKVQILTPFIARKRIRIVSLVVKLKTAYSIILLEL